MHGIELKGEVAEALARFARRGTPDGSFAPRWEAVLEPVLDVSGEGVSRTASGWQVDFGRLPSRGDVWRIVRIESLGQEGVLIRRPSERGRGLRTRGIPEDVFLARGGESLEFQVGLRTEELGADRGSLRWSIEAESGRGLQQSLGLEPVFEVPAVTPRGLYSFQGVERPALYDFGRVTFEAPLPAYEIRVDNETTEPVMVSLSHLTSGLVVEVGTSRFEGPQPGLFCRQPSPVAIRVRPDAAVLPEGRSFGRLVVETNDERPDRQSFDLEFTALVGPRAAVIEALSPPVARVVCGGRVRLDLFFRNRARHPITLEPQPAARCEMDGPIHLPAATATETSWATRTVVLSEIGADEAQRVLVFQSSRGAIAPVVVRILLEVVSIRTAFAGLDFGLVPAGERRELSLLYESTGDEPPPFQVRVLAPLGSVLRARFVGGTLQADLRPDPAAVDRWPRYDGPGLEVTVPELGFVHELGVRFQTRSSWTERLRRTFLASSTEVES